jgi:NAD-dependent DNA ligase
MIEQFKIQGISFVETLTENKLNKIIREANKMYYCNNKPIMTDNEYDIIREYIENKYPDNKAIKEQHTACQISIIKKKATLPYEMWSMDKIKPDTKALKKWIEKYKGGYVLSCKLDGVSGLYTSENNKKNMYTRGNGKVGQDITHLIPYLKLPKEENIAIRGEFIIKKSIFDNKYKNDYANSRNFVAGLINQKNIDKEKIKDIDFVAYEVIKPELKPSQQFEMLKKMNIISAKSFKETNITNELLSKYLIKLRKEYDYEIDGIICSDDNIYKRESKNPEHAFAFKMVLSDQIAEAKVVDVIWTPSKDGYLKPRVQIEPVILGGAKIEYATGFNAKFIKDNNIGVGTIIKLIRSGDVIPHIQEVIISSENPLMPTEEYEWNKTMVDIMLKNKVSNDIVKNKVISGFFKSLDVEGLGSKNIEKIIVAGYDTIEKILVMEKADFLKIETFKEKSANKFYESIKEKIKKATLPELMHATNIFSRGFGVKKLTLILDKYPDILINNLTEQEIIDKLLQIDGMAIKTASQFATLRPEFVKWIKTTKLENKLTYKQMKIIKHELTNKRYILTGFRNKSLITKLTNLGAIQGSSVTKNIDIVIVKSLDDETGKMEEAKILNIPIITLDKFIEKYNIN